MGWLWDGYWVHGRARQRNELGIASLVIMFTLDVSVTYAVAIRAGRRRPHPRHSRNATPVDHQHSRQRKLLRKRISRNSSVSAGKRCTIDGASCS